MRTVTLILMFTLNIAFAEDEYGTISEVGDDGFFDKVSSSPEFKQFSQDCLNGKDEEQLLKNKSIQKCVINKLYSDYESNPKKYQKYLTSKKGTSKLTSSNSGVQLKGKEATKVQLLEDYLSKRLSEAFYGTGEITQTVQHEVFYDLYQSQLGKNIIAQLTGYCLEAVHPGLNGKKGNGISFSMVTGKNQVEVSDKNDSENVNNYSIPDKKKFRSAVRATNIRILPANNAKGESLAYKSFENCLAQVMVIGKLSNKDNVNLSEKYTNGQLEKARIVVHNIKSLRDSLVGIEDTKEKLDKIRKGEYQSASFNDANVRVYDPSGEKNLDSLTEMTSGEYAQNVGKVYEEQANTSLAEACINNPDTEACGKHVYDAKDVKNFESQGREQLARIALLKASYANMDDEELKKELEKEGRTQAEIEAIFANSAELEKIKTKMSEELEQEKLAILNAQKNKLNDLFIDETTPGRLPSSFKTVQDNVRDDIEQSESDFSEVLHYHNIVASYLSIDSGVDENGDKIITRNVEIMQRELDDSYFNPENKVKSDIVDEDHYSELNESVKDIKGKSKASTRKISSKDVNEAILYRDEAKKRQNKKNNP